MRVPVIFQHSLSRRLLGLSAGIFILATLFGLTLSLGSARRAWIADRILEARTGDTTPIAIDLHTEDTLSGSLRAVAATLALDATPVAEGRVVIDPAGMGRDLRAGLPEAAAPAVLFGLLLAGATYAGGMLLLLRPARALFARVAATRTSWDQPPTANDRSRARELAAAALHLDALDRAVLHAQWHRARTAALTEAVRKLGHDLRGVFSPALLTAERLQSSADPAGRRAGDAMLRTIERATDLLKTMADDSRDGMPQRQRDRLALRPIIETVIATAGVAIPELTAHNLVPADIHVEANAAHLAQALHHALSLLPPGPRILTELGKRDVTLVLICSAQGGAALDPADGLRAFSITRDLMRAEGGEATMTIAGTDGDQRVTAIRLMLPLPSFRARPSEPALAGTSPRSGARQ